MGGLKSCLNRVLVSMLNHCNCESGRSSATNHRFSLLHREPKHPPPHTGACDYRICDSGPSAEFSCSEFDGFNTEIEFLCSMMTNPLVTGKSKLSFRCKKSFLAENKDVSLCLHTGSTHRDEETSPVHTW